ncbi:hypothetical protein OS125_11495 [Corynebacterium sp. P7003]|uniref:Uncharacterized protein n=1 Tax=Corynebacterium pygosceleis TaxID=2800406 RepID=A0ABT3WUF0_9CORY|nr:hypothetical protein [Corynebacterium pygosceleis]MCX7445855.1 hypothetical protein [Corynebacterium pygosceleis]
MTRHKPLAPEQKLDWLIHRGAGLAVHVGEWRDGVAAYHENHGLEHGPETIGRITAAAESLDLALEDMGLHLAHLERKNDE